VIAHGWPSSTALYLAVGSRVVEMREGAMWPQRLLARKVGMSTTLLARIERGDHPPSLRILSALCIALNCTIADLVPPAPEEK
jgi:transcriptional regulator with XRE-family HTH domain